MNQLRNTRCYLCGPMDYTTDNGEGWRKQIRHDLDDLGIIWLDPTRKPTSRAIETDASRQKLAEAKESGDFDYVCKTMKVIRSVDLRLTDMSDFLVVHLDTRIYSFGTIEELTNANREKKPIVVHCEQGKNKCPNWLLGMIPHRMVFSTWDELYAYLRAINSSEDFDDARWQFFILETT